MKLPLTFWRRAILVVMPIVLMSLLVMSGAVPAWAADTAQSTPNFEVNSSADTNDGTCSIADCTLREAINAANSNADASTITFSAFFNSAQTIQLGNAQPNIATAITIAGPGANLLTVRGDADAFDPFTINNGVSATLSDLTIDNGNSCINNLGTVVVTNGTFSGNQVGIYNPGGTVTATNCTFSGNGDGIQSLNNGAMLTVTNCTFNGNSRYGIFNSNDSTLTATNCTASGNQTGINNDNSTATVTNCTISGNSQFGIHNNFDTVTLQNSIVVGNTPNIQNDNGGAVNSGADSIVSGTVTTAGLDPAGLQDNGGLTKTIKLLNTSPAIDAGNSAFIPGGVTTDQRGLSRTIGANTDSGAVEFEDYLTVSIAPTKSDTFSEAAGVNATTVRITRYNSTAAPLSLALRSSAISEATIQSNATIDAGNSFVDVPVNAVNDALVDGTQDVQIKATPASATGYLWVKQILHVTDDDGAAYALSAKLSPNTFAENKAGTVAVLEIAHNRPSVTSAVVVTLSSDDTRLVLPPTLTIPAGARKAIYNVTVTPDAIVTGTAIVTITGTAGGFTNGTVSATIYDAQATLAIAPVPGAPTTISEGPGNTTTTLRISRNTPTTSSLVVNLTVARGAGQVSLPLTATLDAGQSFVDITVTAIDDAAVDGLQNVMVQVTSTGYKSVSTQLRVADNDGS